MKQDYLADIIKFYQDYAEATWWVPAGFAPSEVTQFERDVGIGLPKAFKEYLAWAGRSGLASIKPLPMEQNPKELLMSSASFFSRSRSHLLPESMFMLGFPDNDESKFGVLFWFFLSSSNEDPAIYSYWMGLKSIKYHGLLTDFLFNNLRLLIRQRFARLVIGVTPNTLEDSGRISTLPFWRIRRKRNSKLTDMIVDGGGIIGDFDIWQRNQIIIVGEHSFDKDYLMRSVELGLRYQYTCHYFSLSDFQNYCMFMEFPQYRKRDVRIRNHPGLDYLSSIGFKWPSLDPTASIVSHGGDLALNEEHPLRSLYGYSVRRGVLPEQRRAVLRRAIHENALGLEEVAKHIAFLIRMNKRQGKKLNEAVEHWESDLHWLFKTYYEGKTHSFVWPK